MHQDSRTRWVLAFDASCAACQRLSRTIGEASHGRLEMLPLADKAVRRWREQALGADASWLPTLIGVRDERVRAWTGVRMGLRLVRRLGPRYTVRVLRALGELGADSDHRADRSADGLMPRRGLFKLGAGVGIATGLVLTGKAPVFAASDSPQLNAARKWAQANQVPHAGQYAEFTEYPLEYRPAIFDDLSPSVRSHLWTEQISRYRSTHPDLTAEQVRVLNECEAIVADEATFAELDASLRERVSIVETAAIGAFGRSEACGLLFTLGPINTTDRDPVATATCNCRRNSACNSDCFCTGCAQTSAGCGCFWVFACNGLRCA